MPISEIRVLGSNPVLCLKVDGLGTLYRMKLYCIVLTYIQRLGFRWRRLNDLVGCEFAAAAVVAAVAAADIAAVIRVARDLFGWFDVLRWLFIHLYPEVIFGVRKQLEKRWRCLVTFD